MTLFFFLLSFKICLAQTNFKGKITYQYKNKIVSDEILEKESTCIITFNDSVIIKEFFGDNKILQKEDLLKGILTINNLTNAKIMEIDMIETDSINKHFLNKKIYTNDTLNILGLNCFRATNEMKSSNESEFLTSKIFRNHEYYLSELSYKCINPRIAFDEIFNNGFDKIPLKVFIESRSKIAYKTINTFITYEAVSIEIF